jgi:hypothetical protein
MRGSAAVRVRLDGVDGRRKGNTACNPADCSQASWRLEKRGLSHNLWARAGAEVRSLEAGEGRLRLANLMSRNHTAAPPCGGKKGDPQGGRALAREKQLVTKEKNHSRRAANFSCWPGTHGGIPKFAAEE